MAYSVVWSNILPADAEAASLGDDRIREFKVQVYERLIFGSGAGGTGLADTTGTRTVDTDPAEVNPNKADTIALSRGAGGWNAVARAATYFEVFTNAANLSVTSTSWASFSTPVTITIPSPPLAADIAHASGSARDTSDYAIFLIFEATASLGGSSGDIGHVKIRNTTAAADVSPAIQAADVDTFSNTGNIRSSLFLLGHDFGRTAATTYEVLGRATAGATLRLRGDQAFDGTNTSTRLYAAVFKR